MLVRKLLICNLVRVHFICLDKAVYDKHPEYCLSHLCVGMERSRVEPCRPDQRGFHYFYAQDKQSGKFIAIAEGEL